MRGKTTNSRKWGHLKSETWLTLLYASAVCIGASLFTEGAQACPYFTREAVERSAGVTRMNRYAPGSWVCHKRVMWLCGSNGQWRNRGPCTGYQNWERTLACRIERTGVGPCAGSGQKKSAHSNNGGQSGSGQQDRTRDRNRQAGNRAGAGNSGLYMDERINPGDGSSSRPPNWALAPGSRGPNSDLDNTGADVGSNGSFRSQNNQGSHSDIGQGSGAMNGPCGREQARIERKLSQMKARLARSGRVGVCQLARITGRQVDQLEPFYRRCPTADPGGEMMQYLQKLRAWSRTAASQNCVR